MRIFLPMLVLQRQCLNLRLISIPTIHCFVIVIFVQPVHINGFYSLSFYCRSELTLQFQLLLIRILIVFKTEKRIFGRMRIICTFLLTAHHFMETFHVIVRRCEEQPTASLLYRTVQICHSIRKIRSCILHLMSGLALEK